MKLSKLLAILSIILLAVTGYVGYEVNNNIAKDKMLAASANQLKGLAMGMELFVKQSLSNPTQKIDSQELQRSIQLYDTAYSSLPSEPLLDTNKSTLEVSWNNTVKANLVEIVKLENNIPDLQILKAELLQTITTLNDNIYALEDEITKSKGSNSKYTTPLIRSVNDILKRARLIEGSDGTIKVDAFNQIVSAGNQSFSSAIQLMNSGFQSGGLPRNNKIRGIVQSIPALNEKIRLTSVQIKDALSNKLLVNNLLTKISSSINSWQLSLNQTVAIINSIDSQRDIGLPLFIVLLSITLGLMAMMALAGFILPEHQASTAVQETNKFKQLTNNRSKELNGVLGQLEKLEEGDLTVYLNENGETTSEIAKAINKVVLTIKAVISQTQSTVADLSAAAEQSVKTSAIVEKGKEDQIRIIEDAYDRLTNDAKSLDLIVEQSTLTSNSARQTQDQVKRGIEAVKTVSKSNESVRAFQKNITSKMRSTLESVQGLSEITSEISETNQQVKLISVHLGLLATQADGDLEKNMKNSSETMHKHTDNLKQNIAHFLRLIEKVTNEAQETREAVNESINATENMLNLNKDSHEALNKIDQESTKLLNHASSVQSSVAQMKSNSSEVIGTVKNVKQHIIDGAAHSQDTASAISDVTEKSNKLSKTVKHFKTTK